MNMTLRPAGVCCWRDVTSSAKSPDEDFATEQSRGRGVPLPLLLGTDDLGFRCPPVFPVVGTGALVIAIFDSVAAPPAPVAPPWFAGPGRRILLQTRSGIFGPLGGLNVAWAGCPQPKLKRAPTGRLTLQPCWLLSAP